MAQCMLTTFDNPFDPFVQFDQWYQYDLDNHHDCCSLLDRNVHTSDQLSDLENEQEVERAIDEIIKYDFQNKYKKSCVTAEKKHCGWDTTTLE